MPGSRGGGGHREVRQRDQDSQGCKWVSLCQALGVGGQRGPARWPLLGMVPERLPRPATTATEHPHPPAHNRAHALSSFRLGSPPPPLLEGLLVSLDRPSPALHHKGTSLLAFSMEDKQANTAFSSHWE